MTIVKIDGKEYNALVTDIKEDFNILYSSNTGRTMAQGARMTLDPLGTFFGHNVTFARKPGYEDEYDALYAYLSVPRINGIAVEIVHNQKTIKYDAYVSKGSRSVQRIDAQSEVVYWSSFTANIVPMEAQIKYDGD